MAIRKIPLKEQHYLREDSSSIGLSSSRDKAEDPSVISFHARIRKTLLTDRALHDKVCVLEPPRSRYER